MLMPENESELVDLVAGAQGPLAVEGGNTHGIRGKGDVLCTAGLSGVELYEPGALTMVARAGTPVGEIEKMLAENNQRIAFEPVDFRGLMGTKGSPTIGGVVAGNISGPRRVQVGAARDFLLGVRFVDGQGRLIRNGGRVMKNVTGYDLVKLMAGSWGTLGVLSEVAFKVLPQAEAQATIMIKGVDTGTAVKVMSAALGSPFEVSGAAYDPEGQDGPVVMLRIEGFEASVAYRTERLADLLKGYGEAVVAGQPGQSAQIWKAVRDVEPFHERKGDVWRLSVKPTDAPALAERLKATGVLFDWGGGLIWALMPQDCDLRARAGAFDGHATLVRARSASKARLGMFQPLPARLEEISAGLRARFDPRGILNAGLMLPASGN